MPVDARQFRQAVGEFQGIYKEHIRIEDQGVFPVAGKTSKWLLGEDEIPSRM
jgi:hypothetical protein